MDDKRSSTSAKLSFFTARVPDFNRIKGSFESSATHEAPRELSDWNPTSSDRKCLGSYPNTSRRVPLKSVAPFSCSLLRKQIPGLPADLSAIPSALQSE